MIRNCTAYQKNGFSRCLLVFLVVFSCIGVGGIASGEEGEKTNSPYVGTWKLEKLMPQPGQEWLEAKYPFIMQLWSNGKLDIHLSAPNQKIHITGTWKILGDGRVQVSQEGQDGETFERPAIIVFSLEKGRLIAAPRAYVNENEKAQPGFIFKKEK